MARPTKLTPALQQGIVNAVAVGVPLAAAARLVGVDANTALEWYQRDTGTHPTRPTTKIYAEFAETIKRAKAADEACRLARIEQAGKGGAVVFERTTTFPNGKVQTDCKYSEL